MYIKPGERWRHRQESLDTVSAMEKVVVAMRGQACLYGLEWEGPVGESSRETPFE